VTSAPVVGEGHASRTHQARRASVAPGGATSPPRWRASQAWTVTSWKSAVRATTTSGSSRSSTGTSDSTATSGRKEKACPGLRRVHEAVWGTPLDARNFHRKVTGAPGLLEPVGTSTTRDGGGPAQLFRRGPHVPAPPRCCAADPRVAGPVDRSSRHGA